MPHSSIKIEKRYNLMALKTETIKNTVLYV